MHYLRHTLALLLFCFSCIGLQAQVGYNRNLPDSLQRKFNEIESLPDGSYCRLTSPDTLPGFAYQLSVYDTAGTVTLQTQLLVPESNGRVTRFQIDTVTQRLLVGMQSEDSGTFYLRQLVLNYSLQTIDSFTITGSKIKWKAVALKGCGVDLSGNQFLIYSSQDLITEFWSRCVSRKTPSGAIKNNVITVGQAPNDGYYINDCIVTPGGNIYIGGTRVESLFGNYLYFERLNSFITSVFEKKDQLIAGNYFNSHVSSIHVYNSTTSSQVVIAGSIYGLAPGDTVLRSHGLIRAYTSSGTLRWNYQNLEVRDYKKVIGKSSYVYAVGTNNLVASGLDSKLTRLFLKDGVLDWNRYYGSKSIPRCLIVEKDGNLVIAGEKEKLIALPSGLNLTARTFMLVKYSRSGKRLYDFDYPWYLPATTNFLYGNFTDLATGKFSYYYAAGHNRIGFDNGAPVFADSVVLQQFTNGALRIGNWQGAPSVLQLHPNPANNFIYFRCEEAIIDLLLLDSKGALFAPEQLNQEENNYTINIQPLKPGVYVLQVRTEKGWKSGRFIRE